jgi:hypothetical protein
VARKQYYRRPSREERCRRFDSHSATDADQNIFGYRFVQLNVNVVAGQSATIRFGRGRRPRGPTYARGTIRSLFEDQEQATQRTAYDVATRPPCRNLFGDAHFEIIQFVCAVNQFIFSLSGQGSFFVYRFTFSFAFSFAFSFTFGFRFFLSRFIYSPFCRVWVPAVSSFFQFRTVVRRWSVLWGHVRITL